MAGSRGRGESRGGFPGWTIWALAAAFLLASLASGALAYAAVRDLAASWSGGVGLPTFRGSGGQTSGQPVAPGEPTPTAPVVLEETAQPWDGTDRVTVLVMGLDFRDWLEGDGPPRTDSMMLVTVDPVTKTAGMLSIPRDLWVEIPGFEHNRINTAYFLGETYNLPGGGPGLAMKTVENFLGVPIQYYAVIEFSAFERAIDEIGGIDVWVHEDIKISPIGKPSRWLEGGKGHHLNGADALAYARARKTEGGDFDRARRQQQVALAILDRVVGFDMVPTLVRKAPALYQEVASGIRTNLTFEQMLRLGLLAVQIPEENIKRGVIAPPEMVTFVTLPDGAQVLRPVPDKIRQLRDEIFTTTGPIGPALPTEDPAAAARAENARIAVLNGAGVEGLAGRTAEWLRGQGVEVAEVGNADRLDYAKTLIIDYTGNPYTTRYLMELMGLSQGQVLLQIDFDREIDVAVVLGADWSVP